MSDPVILFVKPKTISARDKRALKDAGVIVVEIDDVASIKFVRANAELSGSDLLIAAGDAIMGSGFDSVRAAFGNAVCAAITARRGARNG